MAQAVMQANLALHNQELRDLVRFKNSFCMMLMIYV